MYTQIKTLSILAIAGTAIAAPQGWGNWGQGHWRGGNDNGNQGPPADVDTEVAVVTAYTTVYAHGSQPTPMPQAPPAPAPAPEANPGQFYGKPEAPAPSTPTTPASSSDSGSSGGYMATVNEWRTKMGLSELAEDSTLQANALKTAVDGKGQMVHELNPGSMAQVLAPGSPDEFEKVFVGGWLCEVPTLPGLDGICSSMSAGWDYAGQTGHADIISSKQYHSCGCGNADGIWACDFA